MAPNRPPRSKSRQQPDAVEGADENALGLLDLYPSPATQNQYALDLLRSQAAKIKDAPDGKQERLLNDCAFKVGGVVGVGAIGIKQACEELVEAAMAMTNYGPEPWRRGYVEYKVWRAVADGTAQPDSMAKATMATNGLSATAVEPLLDDHGDHFNLTDTGNGRRFAQRYNSLVRYCPQLSKNENGCWLHWTGTHWASDDLFVTQEYAKATAAAIALEYPPVLSYRKDSDGKDKMDENGDPIVLKNLTEAWAQSSESQPKIRAMLESAKSIPPIASDASIFDTHPMLLNVENGTIDLTTQTLRSHSRDDMLTQCAPVNYDPDAKCPRWKQFLLECHKDDHELCDFLQRWIGYCLTGDMREQRWVLHVGDGSNGKSTFNDIIGQMLGDYVATAAASTFMENERPSSAGSPRPDLMALRSARLVNVAESNNGQAINEALVKRITGGDKVSARELHCAQVTFKPVYKIQMATNELPRMKSTDGGTWRRPLVIMWPVNFGAIGAPDIDKTLAATLEDELPGILNWALEGCREWQESGLRVPGKVSAWTDEYRENSDVLKPFIEEVIVFANDSTILISDLYKIYKEWERASGNDQPWGKQRFNKEIKRPGFEQHKSKTGQRVWRGVSLTERGEEFRQLAHGSSINGDFKF